VENAEIMNEIFSGKVIYILSPQSWDHIKISKHHYALELAKNNTVYFISPPLHGKRLAHTATAVNKNLKVIGYTIPSPGLLRFKFPALYKWLVRFYLIRLLKSNFPPGDFCIDFGCYQLFDSVQFFPARYKIFFPVDDFESLKPDLRGCNIVFTVSTNIHQKYAPGVCYFINHGLSDDFASISLQSLERNEWKPKEKIRVGYAGNLFLKFIDTVTLRQLITTNPRVDFNFFGSHAHNPEIDWHHQWNEFLIRSDNVILQGQLNTSQLAEKYGDMDIFLLCYQPDYKNYHGENSHKVLEYLSTGKILVSTYLSLYQDSKLMVMSPKDKNEALVSLFARVVAHLNEYNTPEQMRARKIFALANTYAMQLDKMASIISSAKSEIDHSQKTYQLSS
jgi:hypothetical protein